MVLFALADVATQAQQAASTGADLQDRSQGYTLHVYEDLIQIPALVLTPLVRSYVGLHAEDFTLRLDAGPPFHPRSARVQGDDPLNLGVVLDVSHDGADGLTRRFAAISSEIADRDLLPSDRVSVFAFDCNLVQTALGQPASAAAARSSVEAALEAPLLHRASSQGEHCGRRVHLVDALALAAARLSVLPGRRVLLIVTRGEDEGSQMNWNALRTRLNEASIASFGVSPSPAVPSQFVVSEDELGVLCNGTGGLLLYATRGTLRRVVSNLVSMVRGRYILDFAPPADETNGPHILEVRTSDPRAIVRSSGTAVSLRNKAFLADPNTVPNKTVNAPVPGNRKPIAKPQ